MKSIVKQRPEPGLWMKETPEPIIGDHEVLIRTKRTSICGTDIHIYKWDSWSQKTIPVPMIIGHEFMGEIVEIGKHVTHLEVGSRVSGEGHITCGCCLHCLEGKRHLCKNTLGLGVHRPGCFTEYFSLPAENVFVLPDSLDDDIASFLDPMGNATHTALCFNVSGEDVLITGAGPIGIMAAAIAKKAGARHVVITDLNPYRLELANKLGIKHTVNIQNESLDKIMESLEIKDGFKVGLEMSGNKEALTTLLQKCQNGGEIALLGIIPPGSSIDWDLVIFKMLTIKGIYGREIFATWHKMVNMLNNSLDFKNLITHRYPAEEFQKGFDVMMRGECGKVVLSWE